MEVEEEEQQPLQAKRSRNGDTGTGYDDSVGGGGGDSWENLSSEILSLIFIRIPAVEMVRSIPLVCKFWKEVVAGPYCWAEIDIERWCRRCNDSDRIDALVKDLVRRSNGTCRRLSAFKLSNAAFAFVVNCGKCLKVLQVPMSNMTDKVVIKHRDSLKLLTFLDISYCLKITCKGLEALGKNCKTLIHLRRNMPPAEWQPEIGAVASKTDDGEALVIADTMPALRHLELGYGGLTDVGLDAILTKCTNLDHLDIIGCNGVKLGAEVAGKCDRLTVFRDPWADDYEAANAYYSDSSDEGDEFFSDSELDSELD